MFKRVIVAVDGSERALDALRLAEALVDADGALIVSCVHHFRGLSALLDPTEPHLDAGEARACVDAALALVERDIQAQALLLSGANAASTLQRAARSERAELIVLGSSRRGTLGRVFIGSAAQQTLHDAPCAVAIAPLGFHAGSADAIARVTVAYDVVEPMPDAVDSGVALCAETGAELRLLVVAEDAAVADPARATMPFAQITEARLETAREAAAAVLDSLPATLAASSEIRDGDPAEQLLEATDRRDLLVLGSHGRSAVARLVMGSVCDAVVRAARCPVLVIPRDRHPGDSESS